MIKSVNITDPEVTPVEWWVKVFPEPRSWEFAPGMNVLWGKNGSGKTTLVKLLARLLHCEQGGVSTVTNQSISTLIGRDRFRDLSPPKTATDIGVSIEHDGTSVVYFDPTNSVGLMGGMAAFDYDFGMTGMMNAMMKGSSGQLALHRLADVMERYTPEIQYKSRPEYASELVKELLKPSVEVGPRTLLMDEPDANLDWPTKLNWWTRLDVLALDGKFQIIVATHSICALRLAKANYIEIPEPGYLKESRDAVSNAGFLSTKPMTLAELMDRRILLELADASSDKKRKRRTRK